MKAREAIDAMTRHRGDAVAVCALGMAANEWWAATKSEDAFYMHGAMGFAASFTLPVLKLGMILTRRYCDTKEAHRRLRNVGVRGRSRMRCGAFTPLTEPQYVFVQRLQNFSLLELESRLRLTQPFDLMRLYIRKRKKSTTAWLQ